MRDRPDRARRDLADTPWAPPEGQYHLQHFYELLASAELALYEGTLDENYDDLMVGYEKLEKTLLLRIQMVRVFARWSRARIAVANGDAKCAKQYARRLEREGIGYASVFAGPVRAALAARRGDVEHAAELLDDAIATTEAHDMAHVGWVCRRRRGELLGGEEGRAILADVDVWMESEDIRDPSRFAEVFAPGFSPRS